MSTEFFVFSQWNNFWHVFFLVCCTASSIMLNGLSQFIQFSQLQPHCHPVISSHCHHFHISQDVIKVYAHYTLLRACELDGFPFFPQSISYQPAQDKSVSFFISL